MSREASPILAELDVQNLQSYGLVSHARPDGTRRLHKRRLTPSSDEENFRIPLDISLESPAADDAFATIPDVLISHATLVHIGFSQSTADKVWQDWINWGKSLKDPVRETDEDPGYGLVMTFDDYFTGAFDTGVDTWSDQDSEWFDCLDDYGLAVEAQSAIMDPRFRELRLTNTCSFWAKDMVEMRFAGLRDIQKASRVREMAIKRAAKRPGGSSSGDKAQSHPTAKTKSHEKSRSVSSIQRQSYPGMADAGITSIRTRLAQNTPGYTILYKGLDQARVENLLDSNGKLNAIRRLASPSPTDFSAHSANYYFSPDVEVAEYYANYAKRRIGVHSVVIVQMAIPNSAIEQLVAPEIQRIYWPDPKWSELIFLCRQGGTLPTDLRRFRLALLVIGTIAKKPTSYFEGLSSAAEVGRNCVLGLRKPTGGRPAVQYCFSGENGGAEFLKEHCADTTKVLPYTKDDFEAVMSEERRIFYDV